MTAAQLANKIARREGKKHQASIGDIREIVGILSDMMVEENGADIVEALIVNGKKREARNKTPRK